MLSQIWKRTSLAILIRSEEEELMRKDLLLFHTKIEKILMRNRLLLLVEM